MFHSDRDDVVVLANVLVVRRTDFGWQCVIQGRQVFLSSLQIAPGSLMPADGERGAVTLTAAAAEDLSLP
jgi:hypothetical protein